MSVQDQLSRALRDVRISVIDRCNYRCPYCMPEASYPRNHAFLNSEQRLSLVELERLVAALVQLGMRKLRITGGEPLLRKDLAQLIAALKVHTELEIALTTNGSLLAQQALALKAAGLHRLTISLDSLAANVFSERSGGRGSLAEVMDGVRAAEAAGFASIKFNCVVQRGKNEADVPALAAHFRGTNHVVRFIEYMDVGSCNAWQADQVVSVNTMREWIHARFPLHPQAMPQGSDVAERFAYQDGLGEVGFISSISKPFCRSCTRARISADGKMYTCLFAHQGHDLKALLRHGSAEDLQGLIRSIWQARTDRYSELRAEMPVTKLSPPRVEMYHIGG